MFLDVLKALHSLKTLGKTNLATHIHIAREPSAQQKIRRFVCRRVCTLSF